MTVAELLGDYSGNIVFVDESANASEETTVGKIFCDTASGIVRILGAEEVISWSSKIFGDRAVVWVHINLGVDEPNNEPSNDEPTEPTNTEPTNTEPTNTEPTTEPSQP